MLVAAIFSLKAMRMRAVPVWLVKFCDDAASDGSPSRWAIDERKPTCLDTKPPVVSGPSR